LLLKWKLLALDGRALEPDSAHIPRQAPICMCFIPSMHFSLSFDGYSDMRNIHIHIAIKPASPTSGFGLHGAEPGGIEAGLNEPLGLGEQA